MSSTSYYMDSWRISESVRQSLSKEGDGFSYMVVSMHVYNALSNSSGFHSIAGMDEISGIVEVGSIFGYRVFLDLYMKPDEILLRHDVASLREYKIGTLLDGEEFVEEKRVKI